MKTAGKSNIPIVSYVAYSRNGGRRNNKLEFQEELLVVGKISSALTEIQKTLLKSQGH